MDKVHVHVCFQNASNKSTAGVKTRFFPSAFLTSTSWFLFLTEAIWNDHVAACSTALLSDTEKEEMGGCSTIPCSSKLTERCSTMGSTKF